MIMYKIDINECVECGFCSNICPKNAINQGEKYAYQITSACVSCSLCAKKCPVKAISK